MAVIVAVIVALLVINRPEHGTTETGPAVQPGPVVTSPRPTPTAAASHTPSPTPSPTSRHTAPAAKPPATHKPVVAKVPVTVLNNSRRYHLARRAAAQVAGGGWPIRQVGNFTGRIRVSTVYYAPGQQRVAAALARQFPAIQRVLPRFSGLPGSGLTLVVTREWPA